MQILAATSEGRNVLFLWNWFLMLLFETEFVIPYISFMFYILAQGQKYAETGFAMSNVTFGDRSTLKDWSTYAVTELHHL